MLELDPDTAGETLSYLGPEAGKLAATARILGLLSGRVEEPPEGFEAAEVARTATTLMARARGLDALEVVIQPVGAPAAAWACTPRVLRVLLIVLVSAARAARGAGVQRLSLEVEGTDDAVALRVGWADEVGREWDTASLEEAADPLARVMALDGGDLVRIPGRATLLLPRMGRVQQVGGRGSALRGSLGLQPLHEAPVGGECPGAPVLLGDALRHLLPHDPHRLGCIDAQAHASRLHGHDHDADPAIDEDGVSRLPAEDQHDRLGCG